MSGRLFLLLLLGMKHVELYCEVDTYSISGSFTTICARLQSNWRATEGIFNAIVFLAVIASATMDVLCVKLAVEWHSKPDLSDNFLEVEQGETEKEGEDMVEVA
jgi:hypothetical protein